MSSAADTHEPTGKPKRLLWLDACRIFAAMGVVLIHSTSDIDGAPFPKATAGQRVAPVLLRAVAELSGAEIFFVISLFLLAAKLHRREQPYKVIIADQARRLLIPYAAWTLFYALFRLVKAGELGYSSAIFAQLAKPQAWADYLLLGSAQYHLHFMPTLFALVLLYPLMRPALRLPALGLTLLGTLYTMESAQSWLWGNVSDPVVMAYVDRLVRIVGFFGYGLAGFALYGLSKRSVDSEKEETLFRGALLCTGLAFASTLLYAASIVKSGHWGARPGASFYGHFLMPALVFACFLGLRSRSLPARLTSLSSLTFGVYLIHPVAIDLYEVVLHRFGWQPAPIVMVLSKYAIAVPFSFAVSYGLSKVPRLAWLIGCDKPSERPAAPIATVGIAA